MIQLWMTSSGLDAFLVPLEVFFTCKKSVYLTGSLKCLCCWLKDIKLCFHYTCIHILFIKSVFYCSINILSDGTMIVIIFQRIKDFICSQLRLKLCSSNSFVPINSTIKHTINACVLVVNCMLTCRSECLTLKSCWGLQSAQTQRQRTVRNTTPAAVRQPKVCISIHLQQQQAESTSIISTCGSTADSGEVTRNIRDKEDNNMWQRSLFGLEPGNIPEPGMFGDTRCPHMCLHILSWTCLSSSGQTFLQTTSIEHHGYQL